jgi:hypothetical protein
MLDHVLRKVNPESTQFCGRLTLVHKPSACATPVRPVLCDPVPWPRFPSLSKNRRGLLAPRSMDKDRLLWLPTQPPGAALSDGAWRSSLAKLYLGRDGHACVTCADVRVRAYFCTEQNVLLSLRLRASPACRHKSGTQIIRSDLFTSGSGQKMARGPVHLAGACSGVTHPVRHIF